MRSNWPEPSAPLRRKGCNSAARDAHVRHSAQLSRRSHPRCSRYPLRRKRVRWSARREARPRAHRLTGNQAGKRLPRCEPPNRRSAPLCSSRPVIPDRGGLGCLFPHTPRFYQIHADQNDDDGTRDPADNFQRFCRCFRKMFGNDGVFPAAVHPRSSQAALPHPTPRSGSAR